MPECGAQGVADVAAALRAAAAQLGGVSDTPRLDAELLLAHALGIARPALLIDPARYAVPAAFAAFIDRRRHHEPVAYILGYQDFRTIRLAVGPGVLIPRQDSETLIDVAVAAFAPQPPATILDLGTGPGTLLFAALDVWHQARGTGVERSAAARRYALANARALGLTGRARIVDGDWHDAAALVALGPHDLILANPPYVEADAVLAPQVRDHEPAEALFAGPDGLADYRTLLPLLPALLGAGGAAVVEVGASQAAAVTALAHAAQLDVTVHRDLAGRDRALLCRRRR